MGYRRTLTLRWSRRDRLAVLVVAVTVAFLTGVTLLGLAMGAQTTALAAGFGTPDTAEFYDSPDDARAAAGPNEYLFLLSTVEVDGADRTVVGIPESVPAVTVRDRSYTFPQGEAGVLAAETQRRTVEHPVDTQSGSETVTLTSRPRGQLVSDRWYVTTPATVDRLGPTGAVVYNPTGGTGNVPPAGAVSLLSALPYFILTTRQLVDLLLLASAAGGVLVAVTAFSVTRVAVDDRRSAIAVIRSTGANPRTVYALFGARALLLSFVGVALGYALGLVLVRAVVNAAVFAGAPTSLTVAVDAQAVSLLAPTCLLLVVLGGLAGVVAARPAVRPPPATVARPTTGSRERGIGRLLPTPIRRWTTPTLLNWDALVPSTATLTVFVLFVLLIAAAGGVLAPLTAADEQTVTEADSPHPLTSRIPVTYAETLQQQGIAASPERLLFETARGEPFVARGVDYEAYTTLSDIRLVRGRPPTAPDEAVVGRDLRQTLGVEVGDTLALGGSTAPAFTRVEIVGVFAGAGIEDDQLLVSLETAGTLAGDRPEMVNLIRTESIADEASNSGSTLAVTDARLTGNDSQTTVQLSVQNYGLSTTSETLTVQVGSDSKDVTVDLRPRQGGTVSVQFSPLEPGTYPVRVGEFSTDATLRSSTGGSDGGGPGFSVSVPDRIPTGTQPAVVVTRDGQPVSGATITVEESDEAGAGSDGETWTTNEQGIARVPFEERGTFTVEATTADARARQDVEVSGSFSREFSAAVEVSPQQPSIATRPEAVATLNNPWSEPVSRTVTLVQGDSLVERNQTLQPGESTQLRLRLPLQPAGSYTVFLRQDGRTVSETRYTVQGDERLAAALISSGQRSSGGGLSQAVELIFGNLQVLLGALVVLVSLMTVGATTASFARAIHAARDEIGVRRAVGASPGGIYRLVLGDVLLIGGVSALLAVGLASGVVWSLLYLGELRLFGIALSPTFSPLLLGGAALCALVLALVSAAVATVSLVSTAPATLLAPVSRRVPTRTGSKPPQPEVRADD